jgi:probable F420-dependent oxidoreductase
VRFCIGLGFSPVDQYVPLAEAADQRGWDTICVSDHVVNPETIESVYPYTKDGGRRWEPFTPWADPWVAIGAMAAVTERLRFTTNVYVLPMRPPFHVAKVVATAAALSGGRVALGIGMGWMEEEFALMEQPFRNRGKRADEMLEVLRKLWAGGWVEHHGASYDFGRVEMHPAPGHVPVYVGGISEPALRRAARNDGWISDLHTTAELAEICGQLRRYRAEVGREDQPFHVLASCKDAYDLDGYRRLEDAGVTHLITQPWLFYGGESDDLDTRVTGIHRFADDILDAWTR